MYRFEPIVAPADERPTGLELIDVFAVRVSPKECSRLLKHLHAQYPLDEFAHLKRVRKPAVTPPAVDILVAPESDLVTEEDLRSSLPELLGLPLDGVATDLLRCPVPRWAPQSLEERDEWRTHWPTDYLQPDRSQAQDDVIDEGQAAVLSEWVRECLSRAEQGELEGVRSATLIVDPFPVGTKPTAQGILGLVPYEHGRGRLMGWGIDRSKSSGRPLRHAVMEAVEDVAAAERKRRAEIRAAGLDEDRSVQPYLCTTYDVFTFREPCIMCAMALVHSRVSRVFFIQPFDDLPEEGRRSAGYTRDLKVHCLKGTNHRYKVYRCVATKGSY
ncbi:cytidine deaminase-like protein [Hyaloraphidium curvatum]|nr:cytidine deaminase-like protein [Hyaloraphidium curvatum]